MEGNRGTPCVAHRVRVLRTGPMRAHRGQLPPSAKYPRATGHGATSRTAGSRSIPDRNPSLMAGEGFGHRGDHVICSRGRLPVTPQPGCQYVARQRYRQPVREGRASSSPSETPVSEADDLLPAASPGHGEESESRVPEGDEPAPDHCRGTFASLDRLGWAKSRLRRLWRWIAMDSWRPSPQRA